MAFGIKQVEERSSQRRLNEAAKAAKRPRVEQAPRNMPQEQENAQQRLGQPERDVRLQGVAEANAVARAVRGMAARGMAARGRAGRNVGPSAVGGRREF
jgi:hypothetical protein